ncbi:hypothetical protein GPECTOR_7g1068 [Gonium pectorale]|uniref:Uncharacterized protein n=1 Tax=Gonium pectorale TaxID=33097 RepID=A0A150GTH5_GONPE|nr:hypothetical protein GPECTOR_7g1068 [Gonium pectorale]|eukprot:KXZ53176.1 hypothetical protein GPECTOR_7g1068 [Gonium pectorale]
MRFSSRAVKQVFADLSPEEDDYIRRVSLGVLQQARGSNVFFADLGYLRSCLLQGRIPPSELETATTSFSASTFKVQTLGRGTKTLDITKSTGVNWKIPRGFLGRYNAASHEVNAPGGRVLRRAASLVGARHDGAREVVAGLWGRVTVADFVEACRQVLGELSQDEEEYVTAIATEQVPADSNYIRDLPYLDKCLQQGRTPTSIKGPELLPTIFLNDTTSSRLADDGMSLRHTGGRVR